MAASADAVVVGESDGFVVASEVLDAVVVAVFAGAAAVGALTCAVFGATGAIVAVKPPLIVAVVAFAPFAWAALVWVACGFAGVAAFAAA